MNIKQAEEATGIQKRNIRFYEKEGLVVPERNESNDYREYSLEDIQNLKLIRMLRTLDMPLDQIKDILDHTITLEAAIEKQKELLKAREKELEIAISFCDELERLVKKNSLDVDRILDKMEQPESQKGLFKQWLDDYKKVAKTEHMKSFVFYPDIAIKNSADFLLALCQYADEQNLNMVITKEGMYPEFKIDGVEYRAERYYRTIQRVPVCAVRCTMVYPELYEADVPKSRKVILNAFHYSWMLILPILFCLPSVLNGSWEGSLHSWQGWVVIVSLLILAGISTYRFWIYYYNERG